MLDATTPQSAAGAAPPPGRDHTPATPFADADGPSFWDLLDIINPLQHIPVVGALYRELTGDAIGTAPRLAGGALFGGLFGLGAALANLVVEGLTGRDAGEHVIALLDEPAAAAPVRTAAAETVPDDTPVTTDATVSGARFFPVPPRGSRAVPVFLPLGSGTAARAAAAASRSTPPQQHLAGADHPLIRAAEARPDGGRADWFADRAMDALEKYRRGDRLDATP